MGFLSKLFNSENEPIIESVEAIRKLTQWEKRHFSYRHYTSDKQNIEKKEIDYSTYFTESGDTISLESIRSPLDKSNAKGAINALKKIVKKEKPILISHVVTKFRERISKEIRRYRDNRIKLKGLSEKWQDDPLFPEIDHLFSEKLYELHNVLLFCRMDQLNETQYFLNITGKLNKIIKDLSELNHDSEEYMSALIGSEHGNTDQALEAVRIHVDAMADTVQDLLK